MASNQSNWRESYYYSLLIITWQCFGETDWEQNEKLWLKKSIILGFWHNEIMIETWGIESRTWSGRMSKCYRFKWIVGEKEIPC